MKLLANKVAVIYGAGGSLGSSIAKAFANAGATIYASGIHLEKIEKLVAQINASGGKAFAAQVDALSQAAVGQHLQSISSPIDISFNAIGWKDVQGTLLPDMTMEDFMRPIQNSLQSNFITATTAAKKMMQQQSGVILTLTATPGGIGYANVGGFGPACCALESLTRNLASEMGPHGIRVVNMRSGGSPDSDVFKMALEQNPEAMKDALGKMENDTMLKQLPLMEDVAQTALFLASAMASKITGCTIDITGGTTQALNYKVTPVKFAKR
ncbi:MAG: SDR family oxidoreductase [Sphingobacteriales bacterium]|nr:MAG: SDR family oxidoreductase [Sphingobacteriales bacterium]